MEEVLDGLLVSFTDAINEGLPSLIFLRNDGT